MKILFISDIHGIKTNLEKVKTMFLKLNCDYLVVLGDLFHGDTKNKDYDPNAVESFLHSFKGKLICLKGNCDLSWEIKRLYIKNDNVNLYKIPKTNIYVTHGHKYNEFNWDKDNTILITGHTHIPKITKTKSNIYLNPGSISKSRALTKESYLVYDNGCFMIYDVDDNIIAKF